MLKPKDYEFLMSIKEYVKNNPEISPMIAEYSQQGIMEKLEEMREIQMKTEAALISSLNRKDKTTDKFILDSLKFIEGKSCFEYKSVIKQLEEK